MSNPYVPSPREELRDAVRSELRDALHQPKAGMRTSERVIFGLAFFSLLLWNIGSTAQVYDLHQNQVALLSRLSELEKRHNELTKSHNEFIRTVYRQQDELQMALQQQSAEQFKADLAKTFLRLLLPLP